MNDRDHLTIERYYRSELTEAERSAFEKQLAEDADFREVVRMHGLAMEAIRLHGRELFKKQLGERPLIKKPRRNRYWLWAGLAGTVVLVCVSFYFYRNKTQTPPISPENPPIAIPEENVPQEKQEVFDRRATSPPPLNPNTEKLFAEAFRPYRDGSVRSTKHSNAQNPDTNSLTGINRLKKLVGEEKYAESLQVYDQLPQHLQSKEVALFYKANSLLALGRPEEAAILFEGIASNPQTAFASQSQWYAALCALKKKDLTKAKKWLQVVTAAGNNASEELRTEANKLLKKLH